MVCKKGPKTPEDPIKLKRGPKKLPDFRNFEEVVEFFESHDATPYLDQLENASGECVLAPQLKARILNRARDRLKKRLLTLRLENRQVEEARRIAREKGVGYLTLMRVWIQEGIRREKKMAV